MPPWHWGFRSGVSVAVLGLLVQNPRLIGRAVGLPQSPFGILRWLAEASPPLVEKLSRFSLLMGLSWLLVFSEAIGTGSLFPALVSSSVGFRFFRLALLWIPGLGALPRFLPVGSTWAGGCFSPLACLGQALALRGSFRPKVCR